MGSCAAARSPIFRCRDWLGFAGFSARIADWPVRDVTDLQRYRPQITRGLFRLWVVASIAWMICAGIVTWTDRDLVERIAAVTWDITPAGCKEPAQLRVHGAPDRRQSEAGRGYGTRAIIFS